MAPPADETDQAHPPSRKANFNVVAAFLFVAFAVALYVITPYQVEKPVVVFGQSLNALDPTLFPRVVAVGMFVSAIWFFIESFQLRERNGFRDLDREAYVNVAVSIVAFALYALLMEPLGFVLSSILLVGGLSFFYGVRSIPLIALASVGVPVAVYFVFTRMLQVFLPAFPEF